jgi:hypothetical protein
MRNGDRKGLLLIVVLWLMALGVFLSGVLLHAQTRANPGASVSSRAARVTVTGTVTEVLRHVCLPALLASQKENTRSRYCATTDVVLTTKGGFVKIRLGPTKFIRDKHFFFVDGDRLLVVGLAVAGHAGSSVVSEEVIKSKRDLTLRDPDDRPLWGRKAQRGIGPIQ